MCALVRNDSMRVDVGIGPYEKRITSSPRKTGTTRREKTLIQTALNWLYDNLYSYMIPVCGLCVLRVIVSFLELAHMKRLRDKKFVFRKVSVQYRDIGAFTGLFIGSVLICLFPKLGLLFAAVAAGLTVLGYQIGKRKGDEADRIWQEVVNELSESEDAHKVNALSVESNIHGLIDTLDVFDKEETPEEAAEETAAAPESEE